MILDSILVGLVILGAVAMLLRYYLPRRRPSGGHCAPACGSCPSKAAPTRIR